MSIPDLLALDFDGVICDGMLEYFQAAWQGYCEVWRPTEMTPPEGTAERFYILRPVIETGWEMPVLVYAILQGISDDEIFGDWPGLVERLVVEADKEKTVLAKALDGGRDRQIQNHLDDWLALHRFYPGAIELVQQVEASEIQLYIVSTKEGRFITQLLARAGVMLKPEQIIGKEVKQPKYETLRRLKQGLAIDTSIWFVEDRLPALELVHQQPDLQGVKLFLADWGYNTAASHQVAEAKDWVTLLDLDTFGAGFDSLHNWQSDH